MKRKLSMLLATLMFISAAPIEFFATYNTAQESLENELSEPTSDGSYSSTTQSEVETEPDEPSSSDETPLEEVSSEDASNALPEESEHEREEESSSDTEYSEESSSEEETQQESDTIDMPPWLLPPTGPFLPVVTLPEVLPPDFDINTVPGLGPIGFYGMFEPFQSGIITNNYSYLPWSIDGTVLTLGIDGTTSTLVGTGMGSVLFMLIPTPLTDIEVINIEGDVFANGNLLSFFSLPNLMEINNISNFDVSNVITMTNMFSNTNLTSLDLSAWNVSNVTSMDNMFVNSNALTSLNLPTGQLNDNVTMTSMFFGVTSLTSITLGNGFSFGASSLLQDGYWANGSTAYTTAEFTALSAPYLAGTWTFSETAPVITPPPPPPPPPPPVPEPDPEPSQPEPPSEELEPVVPEPELPQSSQEEAPQYNTYIPLPEPTYTAHILNQSALDTILDPTSAAIAVEDALVYLIQNNMLNEDTKATLALFIELAISQAASVHMYNQGLLDLRIIINQPNLEHLQNTAQDALAQIESILAHYGTELNRDLDTSVAFITTYATDLDIRIEPSAMLANVDRVRIRTPFYEVSFDYSFFELHACEPLYVYVYERANSPRAYTVNFSRPVEQSMRLSVEPTTITDEMMYLTLQNQQGNIAVTRPNPVTNQLDAQIIQNGTYTVINNRIDFADIQHLSAEMQRAIRTLASQGVMAGLTPTTFAPSDTISRAQVAAVLTDILGINNPHTNANFSDVAPSDWFFSAVGNATQHGIMQGTSQGVFSPLLAMQRDQFVTTTARTLQQHMNYRVPHDPSTYLHIFNDQDALSYWSLGELALATRENLVVRRADGYFMPDQYITRGEASIIMYRLHRRIW